MRKSISSAHLPGRILDPELYQTLLYASYKHAKNGALPLITHLPGASFERAVTPGPWYTGPHSIVTLPADSKATDRNRWSGRRYDGSPGNAGYYMGTPWAVRAEGWYYGVRKTDPSINDATPLDLKAFADKRVFELRLLKTLHLVDIIGLSMRLEQDPDVVSFLRQNPRPVSLRTLLLHQHDYTAARAVAAGIYQADAGYQGLQVITARSHLGVSGDNIVLIDSPSQQMTTVPLEVIKESSTLTPPIRGDGFVVTSTGEHVGLSRAERIAEFKARRPR